MLEQTQQSADLRKHSNSWKSVSFTNIVLRFGVELLKIIKNKLLHVVKMTYNGGNAMWS